MAHAQGNKPNDDPNLYGLKFDSEKPKWGLLPKIQLIKVVNIFNEFIPSGKSAIQDIDLMKFDRENLINQIMTDIMYVDIGQKYIKMTGIIHSLIKQEFNYLVSPMVKLIGEILIMMVIWISY